MPFNNFFQPTPDAGAQPQSQTLAMAQMMDPTGKAMQPDQTPEEHAQAKQGWLDWFKNPSTSAFLMQFGASMMQPNVRGFGAQLGQSLGEAGAAAGREREMEQQQAKQEADAAEAQARAGYYQAETKAAPTLAEAKTTLAQAAQTKAEAAQALAEGKTQNLLQLNYVEQQLKAAQAGTDLARTQELQAQADQLRLHIKYPGLSNYEKAIESWYGSGQLGDRPKPEDFGVPSSELGMAGTVAAGATMTPDQQHAAFVKSLPKYNPNDTAQQASLAGKSQQEQTAILLGWWQRGDITGDQYTALINQYQGKAAPHGVAPAAVQPRTGLTPAQVGKGRFGGGYITDQGSQ